MLKNSSDSYGVVAKLLHLTVAIIVFGLFGLGFWMVDLDYYDDWYMTAPFIHRSIGILFAGLLAFRLFWVSINKKPKPVSNHKAWEIKSAHFAHIFLYAFMVVLVSSGYLISTADGQGISVFNWFEVPAPTSLLKLLDMNNLADIAGFVHKYIAYALMALVALHALASLKHHFIHKDHTLSRMFSFK